MWEDENSRTMRALLACVTDGTCGQNQTHIVLLASGHFRASIEGRVSGEDIWAKSVLVALQEMGYSPLVTSGDYSDLVRTYRLFPDFIKVVIAEAYDVDKCYNDPACVKSPTNPLGVPIWKLLSFHFWGSPDHPLGGPWTLSPENYPVISRGNGVNNTYLGYSIQRTCEALPVVPHAERPKQAYVLAKWLSYFHNKEYAWAGVALDDAHAPARFVAGMIDDEDGKKPVPAGVANFGRLDKKAFYGELSRSRVLVGIGSPPLSPSPYDALCMGVPFVNPIFQWDAQHPEDRSAWITQHDGLKYEHPPHVYNVRKGDAPAFWKAIQGAMNVAIDRYIPPSMTMEALKARVGGIVETDWRTRAEDLLMKEGTEDQFDL